MQEHPAQAESAQPRVTLAVAVFPIARHRMARESRVHADLVRASGADRNVHERRGLAVVRDGREYGDRDLAGAMHAYVALAALPRIGQHRRVYGLATEPPAPREQGRIVLVDRAVAQQRVRRTERGARARHEQAAARVAIEPVHQLERLLGSQGAQSLDGAEGKPGPAVHGEAGRLVQHEDARVFVDDRPPHHLPRESGMRRGVSSPAAFSRTGGSRTSSSAARR